VKLGNSPVVEVVLDIDCDLPPDFDLAGSEDRFREAFLSSYPKLRKSIVATHHVEVKAGSPTHTSAELGVSAHQHVSEDEKQIVQVRREGFSFNRLAPYSGLDACLPEIERAWRLFVDLALPIQIRLIRLRYINLLQLPVSQGQPMQLSDYFVHSPSLPDKDSLSFLRFLDQRVALENETGQVVEWVLASQGLDGNHWPVILDISSVSKNPPLVDAWEQIVGQIQSLRRLNNQVFSKSLTEKCLQLFQPLE
jgi:uncharacterized protein (TIGR04255 family)